MKTIEQLQARLVELHEIGNAIVAKADAEKRDLKPEEQKEVDDITAEFENIEADIGRRGKLEAQQSRLGASQGRVVPPVIDNADANADRGNKSATSGMRNTRLTTTEERQRWGFRSFGEFAMSVKNAAINPTSMDQRLLQNAAASTMGSEGVGADGGFAKCLRSGAPRSWRWWPAKIPSWR